MGDANTPHSGQPLVAALGGGHGLAVSLRALQRVTDHVTAIVGVADDGGSSGRLRRERGILPPGDLRMALAALCDADVQTRPWVEVLQFRFSDGGELSGHPLGNLLLSALWEKTSDPVAGLDELIGLLGCGGRVLPCCVEPLEIVASI
ncbi:MAG: YvcK family protein, partial [Actinobacteria bacterium]|nr:YvcK family protein [Actinomycetota bacterium]